jgi:serine protease Do
MDKSARRVVFGLVAVLGAAVLTNLYRAGPASGGESGTRPRVKKIPGQAARLQERLRGAAKQCVPAVVAVLQPGAFSPKPEKGRIPAGSGVIITADGLILSQYHVTHQTGAAGQAKDAVPGTKTTVILHNGTRAEAELLGADVALDLSLLKLTKPGPYPHAPLGDGPDPAPGDIVLKVGHPRGYLKGRPPLVRCGRVVWAGEGMFVSDAPIEGGDSGGPYFDPDGRLVGIVLNSWAPPGVVDPAGDAISSARGVIPASANALSRVRGCLPSMAKGEVRRPSAETAEEKVRRLEAGAAKHPPLPSGRWSQGRTTLAGYRDVVAAARTAVVAVLDGDVTVVLGTVVGGDGLVVTVASRVPDRARCRLPDGWVVAAEVAGVDPAFDLALLKLPVDGLKAVEWADADPAAGSLLAAPGPDELPIAAGVVSAARRDLPGPHPKAVARARKEPAGLPAVIGSAVEGRGYWVEYAEGNAAAAGVQAGDVILTIGGTPVRSHQDLAACVRGRVAGERLGVRLLRAGRPVELTMTLGSRFSMAVTERPGGYPTVFEHDLPLTTAECGGPVVGLDGKALGLTVARVGVSGCVAVPGAVVRRLVPGLKAGKPVPALPKNPPEPGKASRPAAAGAPVTLTVDRLREKLTERRDRFRSLSVEYDVVSEADVEPVRLLSWNMHHVRDGHESHRVAFAGNKRFQEVRLPPVVPFAAPQDLVGPDPNAPPAVRRSVEDHRQSSVALKGKDDVRRLFARADRAERTRAVYDGETCFTLDPAGKMMRAPPSSATVPSMYLANLGLRPPDPAAPAERRKAQQAYWFPGNLDLYEASRVLSTEQPIDGARCVVLEGEANVVVEGKKLRLSDRIWLDPTVGFGPRRWERRVGGVLTDVRANSDFEKFAAGCWLPWEASWTRCAPGWTAEEFRGRPAYTDHIRLRKARVNDVPENLFKP